MAGNSGFGLSGPHKPLNERVADLAQSRERLREPGSLAQFMAARGWLRQFDKIKTVNKRGTSYGLKHGAARDIGYVTNGVFIAAALAEGSPSDRTGVRHERLL